MYVRQHACSDSLDYQAAIGDKVATAIQHSVTFYSGVFRCFRVFRAELCSIWDGFSGLLMAWRWCGVEVVWCGGVVWCGVVWWCGGVVWCGVVWCGVLVWCVGVVWCGVEVVWCCVVWCFGVVWCGGGVVWCCVVCSISVCDVVCSKCVALTQRMCA